MGVDFRVLGPLEVRRDDVRIALPSPRHQRVLAALLMTPRSVVPLVRLVDVLWAEDPPGTATKQVQNCVSSLRGRLGDSANELIVTDGPGYRIMVTAGQLDSLRFRRGVEAATRLAAEGSPAAAVTACRQALELWRGPTLDGIGSPALAARAARWDEQRLLAIEQCADWQFALGQHRAVLAELGEIAADNPTRERSHVQLMTALAGDGRQVEALAVFRQLRHTLAEELGIDPGSEAVEVHRRILAGAGDTGSAAGTAPARPAGVVSATLAARELAEAITAQWRAESETRSLARPRPVRLTWSGTERPVLTAAGSDRSLRGDLSTLVARYRDIPTRQLLVLGEAGAGKSVIAILLTLGLLDDLRDGDPVPVLFPVASWNPTTEHLDGWLARRLREDYPGLTNSAKYGPDAATRLVLHGHVMPVLDGLDETPPDLHAAAIDALDRSVTSNRPVVVTCRTEEYERAVRASGSLLSSAAVVEVDPVEQDAAVEFLVGRERPGTRRWQPVVTHLRLRPDGPLAQALRTPLMVDLARTAYAGPSAEPVELCDDTRFADRAAVEEHLLDTYLPTVYTGRPGHPGQQHEPASAGRHDTAQARAWLTFLAAALHRNGTRDLTWWRLDRALPRFPRALLLGVLPAPLFAAAGWIGAGPRVGLVYGIAMTLGGTVAHAFGQRSGPLSVELRFRTNVARFAVRFGVGAAIGTAMGSAWTLPPGAIVAVALVFGLSIGTYAWLDRPIDANRVSDPGTVLRGDRLAGLAFTITLAVSLGLFYGMAYAYTAEGRLFLLFGGTYDLGTGAAGALAGAVLGRFMLGAWGAVGYACACAAVGGQVFGLDPDPVLPVVVGTLFGLGTGLAVFLSRTWGSFTVIRLWFAVRGHAPLRLMGFLDDAHRRGVLRQAGAAYQFRHARLQDRLATRR